MPRIICIIICIIVNRLQAQEVYLNTADSLARAGDTANAVKLLKRVDYFFPGNDAVRINLGNLQYSAGDFSSARNTFLSNPDKKLPQNIERWIGYCRAAMFGGYYSELITNTQNGIASLFTNDSIAIRRLRFYQILAYLESDKSAEAMQICRTMLDSAGLESAERDYKNLELHYKNPKKARLLSIFPGLGQAYSGDWRNAANAFFLNGGIITLAVIQGRADVYFGILLAYQFLPRYYLGNMRNASKSAVFANRRRSNALKHTIIREFLRMNGVQ